MEKGGQVAEVPTRGQNCVERGTGCEQSSQKCPPPLPWAVWTRGRQGWEEGGSGRSVRRDVDAPLAGNSCWPSPSLEPLPAAGARAPSGPDPLPLSPSCSSPGRPWPPCRRGAGAGRRGGAQPGAGGFFWVTPSPCEHSWGITHGL